MKRTTASVCVALLTTAASTNALTIVDVSQAFRNRTTDITANFGEQSFGFGQSFTVPPGESILSRFIVWVIPATSGTTFAWSLIDFSSDVIGSTLSGTPIAGVTPFVEAPSPDFLTGYVAVEVFAAVPVVPGHRYMSKFVASRPDFIVAMASMRGDNAYEDGTGVQWESGVLLPTGRDLAFTATFGEVIVPPEATVPEEATTAGLLALGLLPLAWAAQKRRND